jgi:hypothetical protein
MHDTLMRPETVGMSSARLARLDEVLQRRYVESGYFPGTLTYVYRRGQLVHTGICGQMDIERGKAMQLREPTRMATVDVSGTTLERLCLASLGNIPPHPLVVRRKEPSCPQ